MTLVLFLKPKPDYPAVFAGFPRVRNVRAKKDKSGKLKRLIRLRGEEELEIESVELTDEIKEALAKESDKRLETKLHKELLLELKGELIVLTAKQAEIDENLLRMAFLRAKTKQEREDLILLLVAADEI